MDVDFQTFSREMQRVASSIGEAGQYTSSQLEEIHTRLSELLAHVREASQMLDSTQHAIGLVAEQLEIANRLKAWEILTREHLVTVPDEVYKIAGEPI
jgi:hypothetical protein